MNVRREMSQDEGVVRQIQCRAFDVGDGEPIEARLLDALRQCPGWLPALSWVAEVEGRIVGHNVCTRSHVDDVPCVGLGPIAVDPDVQAAGVGTALMHAMIGAADALGEPLIALLGNPAYYERFGFVPGSTLDIAAPEPAWADNFQVLRLSSWRNSIVGTFAYASPFTDLSP